MNPNDCSSQAQESMTKAVIGRGAMFWPDSIGIDQIESKQNCLSNCLYFANQLCWRYCTNPNDCSSQAQEAMTKARIGRDSTKTWHAHMEHAKWMNRPEVRSKSTLKSNLDFLSWIRFMFSKIKQKLLNWSSCLVNDF